MPQEYKNKVLSILKENLGKEFKISELCYSYDLEVEHFVDVFYELEDHELISYMFENKGSIRLVHVEGEKADSEDIEIGLYKFPKDRELFELVQWGSTLPIDLRLEFDECMKEIELEEKLREKTKEERLDFLTQRAEFFKEQREKEKEEIKNLEKVLKKVDKVEDKDALSLEQPAVLGTPDKDRKRRISERYERKENKQITGIEETNAERKIREQKEKEKRRQEKEKEKLIELNKYEIGSIVDGTVVKRTSVGIFVNMGSFDGLVHKSTLTQEDKTYKKQDKLKVEIVDIDKEKKHIYLEISRPKKQKVIKKPLEQKKKVPDLEEKIKQLFNEIEEGGGKDSIIFFAHLVSKTAKRMPDDWCLTFPLGKRRVRLNNGGVEGLYIDKEGMLVVVLNSSKSLRLRALIHTHVERKNYRNSYKKIPEAVPLYLSHDLIKKKRKLLEKEFFLFLDEAEKTGKNPWKKHHSQGAVEVLSRETKINIPKPNYIE